MANDGAGLNDGIDVALNPEPADAPESVTGYVPDRPGDSSSKDKWVAYVVALGADETYVSEETWHVESLDPVTNEAVYSVEPGLTRNDLIELADRLGG